MPYKILNHELCYAVNSIYILGREGMPYKILNHELCYAVNSIYILGREGMPSTLLMWIGKKKRKTRMTCKRASCKSCQLLVKCCTYVCTPHGREK
jgi:hypothetical protein